MNPYCLLCLCSASSQRTLLTFQPTAKSPTPDKFQVFNVLEVDVVKTSCIFRLQTMYWQIGYHRKTTLNNKTPKSTENASTKGTTSVALSKETDYSIFHLYQNLRAIISIRVDCN